MPKSTPLSERVNTVSQERVDKVDFDRLQDMVDQSVRRQMGSLLGYGQGVVSPFTTTYNPATKKISLSRFTYGGSENIPEMTEPATGLLRGWRGGFYSYDPNTELQTNEWSIAGPWTAAKNGDAVGASALMLARPVQTARSTESRVQWSGGAETPVSIKTILGVRHEISFSVSLPADAGQEGWCVVGYISSWSNGIGVLDPGTPTISPLSVFDSQRFDLVNGFGASSSASGNGISVQPLLTRLASGVANTNVMDFTPAQSNPVQDVGLLQLLAFMRGQIARIIDADKAWSWWNVPVDNVNQGTLQGGLQQLWNKVYPLWYDYSTLEVVRPWASAGVAWNAVTLQFELNAAGYWNGQGGSPRNIVSVTKSGSVATNKAAIVKLATPPAGWRYSHAVVTPWTPDVPAVAAASVYKCVGVLGTVDGVPAVTVTTMDLGITGGGLFLLTEFVWAPFLMTVFITKDV